MKNYYELLDTDGVEWVRGEFTKTTLTRILNAYKRAGILLHVAEVKVAA